MTDNLPIDEKYEALLKSNSEFGKEALILTYALAVQELSFYKEKDAYGHNDINYNRNQWCKKKCSDFICLLDSFLESTKRSYN